MKDVDMKTLISTINRIIYALVIIQHALQYLWYLNYIFLFGDSFDQIYQDKVAACYLEI